MSPQTSNYLKSHLLSTVTVVICVNAVTDGQAAARSSQGDTLGELRTNVRVSGVEQKSQIFEGKRERCGKFLLVCSRCVL